MTLTSHVHKDATQLLIDTINATGSSCCVLTAHERRSGTQVGLISPMRILPPARRRASILLSRSIARAMTPTRSCQCQTITS